MTHRITTRLISLFMATTVTLALLSGITRLAAHEGAAQDDTVAQSECVTAAGDRA